MLGQGRQERQAQPAVEQAQALGGVDHEHDRAVGGLEAGLDGGAEALRRRLDRAAVDGHDDGAARRRLGAEGAQQRGLARAGDAVDDGHERPVVVEQREQRIQLALAADQRGAPLGQQRSEGPAHRVRRRGRARGPARATIVAATGLIASTGSCSASACRSSSSGLLAS